MKKLYALLTNPKAEFGSGKYEVIQVSFNKEELEDIATYLNKIHYWSPHAKVVEVDEDVCQWYWPR